MSVHSSGGFEFWVLSRGSDWSGFFFGSDGLATFSQTRDVPFPIQTS